MSNRFVAVLVPIVLASVAFWYVCSLLFGQCGLRVNYLDFGVAPKFGPWVLELLQNDTLDFVELHCQQT